MPNFRVTLQPGIIRDPDQVLTVRFTSPRQAENVTLQLLEMDSWRYRRDTMSEQFDNRDDVIATFTGIIQRGQFQVQAHRLPQGRDRAPRNAPVVIVKFHGSNTEYRLPIPDSSQAEEGGELEIGLEARGEVHRRGRQVEIEYKTPAPVFYRNYGQAGAQQRPLITFITGRGGFFSAGSRYWQRRSDGLIRKPSVEEILDYLNSERNLARYGEGRWGEVNIVSHANTNQWIIRLFAGRRERIGHIDVNVLNRHGRDHRLQAPGADMVDNNTRIVIRGCVIGHNQALLDRIRHLFGGRAYIYAPKYLQGYEFYQRGRERTQREYFTEFFFFYLPGNRSPNERTCIERLRRKYPSVGIDEAEWRNLLRGRGGARRHDRTEQLTYRLDCDDVPPRDRDRLMRELRRQFPNDERTYNTTVDDWQWSIRRQVNRRRRIYRVIFTGSRRRVEVRRPLRDNNGDMVVPNLYDRSHYGRSPRW
ncbi:MAG: hypothetical protein ACE5K8_05445 [Candidatus Zixiibacteriota bacterium]